MSTSSDNDDPRQIGAIMQTYIDGARNGSSDHLRPIFEESPQ